MAEERLNGEEKLTAKVSVYCHPDLKRLIALDVEREDVRGGESEMVVRILAQHYKRPDLSHIPRKRIGRPPKISA